MTCVLGLHFQNVDKKRIYDRPLAGRGLTIAVVWFFSYELRRKYGGILSTKVTTTVRDGGPETASTFI